VALSEKSPYHGGAWVKLGLSNNPESTESCRFEIHGFAGSLDWFFQDERQRFFFLPDDAECVRVLPELIRIPSGNRQAEAGSMIR
jgi:hypothetical protein